MEEKVAACAIQHYENFLHPTKGKPKDTEWTVYAAIVGEERSVSKINDIYFQDANNLDFRLWVVSCATGTKCSTFVPPKNDCSIDEKKSNTISNMKNDNNDNKSKTDVAMPADVESTVLRDGHAETLARRSLMRVLWEEVHYFCQTKTTIDSPNRLLDVVVKPSIEQNEDTVLPQFTLRSDLRLHIYISDSPCGDASIYELLDRTSSPGDEHSAKNELNFTGAKVIVSTQTGVDAAAFGDHQLLPTKTIMSGSNNELSTNKNGLDSEKQVEFKCTVVPDASSDSATNITVVAREDTQLLGKLRTKSGRSNLPMHMRSSCMSCSDKLVRWNIMGLQGLLLNRFIPSPIRLSSIVVSRDPSTLSNEAQLEALDRATRRRVVSTMEYLQNMQLNKTNDNEQCLSRELECFLQDKEPPMVFIVSQTFSQSKSAMAKSKAVSALGKNSATTDDKPTSNRKRKRDLSGPKSCSPCGISLCWDQRRLVANKSGCVTESQHVEQIVGARGLCQGKKPQKVQDYVKCSSQLSRFCLMEFARLVYDSCSQQKSIRNTEEAEPILSSYKEWKDEHVDSTLRQIRAVLFASGPLSGWLAS